MGRRAARHVGYVCSALLLVSGRTGAQSLPSTPITLADGRATIGGDISGTFAPEDTGYFDYTDYGVTLVRMVQLDLAASVNASRHVTLIGSVRVQNTNAPLLLAAYVRIRPWVKRAFDIQAGHVPSTFGSFPRHAYSADNPLIGEPLGYQYLTSLRDDSLPASADELLRMRGRGWLSVFSVGSTYPDHGVPLVSASRWDTGVQAHAANDLVDGTIAVTVGSLSNPLFRDNNGGKQLAGRIAWHPGPGLVIGASAARGKFVSSSAAGAAGSAAAGRSLDQAAWGADVEYSKGYAVVRAEAIISQWTLPVVAAPAITVPLRAWASSFEGRYKVAPGLYAAARYDHLGFNEIAGTTVRAPWDAPVSRIEIGGGYSIQRSLIIKMSFQHNTRADGLVRNLDLVAVQLLFWL
jgi:hypothetical protein